MKKLVSSTLITLISDDYPEYHYKLYLLSFGVEKQSIRTHLHSHVEQKIRDRRLCHSRMIKTADHIAAQWHGYFIIQYNGTSEIV